VVHIDWTSKQKRCYQRIQSGFTVANRYGNTVRFITITSSVYSTQLQKHKRILFKRIKRKFGEFEYLGVRTSEGNGVVHILYRGCFIPQAWLSNAWRDIHNSPVVDIRVVRPFRGLGRYIVSQYLSDQDSAFQRYSWSWGWVYRGFVRNWKTICRLSCPDYKLAVQRWNGHLNGFVVHIGDDFINPYPFTVTVQTEQLPFDADATKYDYGGYTKFYREHGLIE
jgi:hypothetical protein